MIVLHATNGTIISTTAFQQGGGTDRSQRAILINSAGTAGFMMDLNANGNGNRIFRFNP